MELKKLRQKKGGNVFLTIVSDENDIDYNFFIIAKKFRKNNPDDDFETFIYQPDEKSKYKILFCAIKGFREWFKEYINKHPQVEYYQLCKYMNRERNIIYDNDKGLFVTMQKGNEIKKIDLNKFIAIYNLDKKKEYYDNEYILFFKTPELSSIIPTERPLFSNA